MVDWVGVGAVVPGDAGSDAPLSLLPVMHGRRAVRAIVAATLAIDVSELLAAEAAGGMYGDLGRRRGVSINELVAALVRPLEEGASEFGAGARELLMTRLTTEAVLLIEIGWQRPG